jgi:thioesterase domain-containing protein
MSSVPKTNDAASDGQLLGRFRARQPWHLAFGVWAFLMSQLVPHTVTPRGLTLFLHEQIPLTRAMELRAVEAGDGRLVLEAPLAPNRNHLGTAFGGSLHTLPTLACYGTLWMILREAGLDGHVVVKRTHAIYRTPVEGTLRAVCARPGTRVVTEFLADLRRHKKARMDLAAIVEGANGKPAVELTGAFVAVI